MLVGMAGSKGFYGLPREGFFKELGFGIESKSGPRLSGRQVLQGLLPLPATDNAPGCLGQALVVSHSGTSGSLGSVYLCAALRPRQGGVQAPFNLPA